MGTELEIILGVFVRLATIADLESLFGFYTDMWQLTYAGIINADYLARMATKQEVIHCMAQMLSSNRRDAITLLAYDHENNLIGIALGGHWRDSMDPEHGENYALYIRPDYQGRGLGRKLWHLRAALMLQRGVRYLHTWVLAPNEKAQNAYHAWGGTPGTPASRTVQFNDQIIEERHYIWDLTQQKLDAPLTDKLK